MTSKKYLITLKPVGNFFFGGERGFGDTTGKNEDEKQNVPSNYLVKGNCFPQQTSLLGMLRYELLSKANLLAPNHKSETAINLIGESGFDGTVKEKYGVIKKLSPVFLTYKGLPVYKLNKMYQAENKEGKKELSYTYPNILSGNSSLVINYDAKHFLNSDYNVADKGVVEVPKTPFTTHQQVGIKKNYQGNTDDDAFFKQTFVRLDTHFVFSFYLETSVELEEKLSDDIVTIGGDQSLFRLEISAPVEKTLFDEIIAANKEFINSAGEQDEFDIILLSDCKVSREIFEGKHLQHSINDIAEFRHLKTKSNTQNFNAVNGTNGLERTSKLEFLTRNSVLFVKGTAALQEVCKQIDSEPAYQAIGYNYYQIQKRNNS